MVHYIAHNWNVRSLARLQRFRMASEPAFDSRHDLASQLQSAPPPPPTPSFQAFQHHTPTNIPHVPSFLDFRDSLWAQPEPTWNIQWLAPSVPQSYDDSDAYAGEMFSSNNYVLDNHPSPFQLQNAEGNRAYSPPACQCNGPVAQSSSVPGPEEEWGTLPTFDLSELDSPLPPTPPPTPISVLNQPSAVIPDDVGFFLAYTPPKSNNIRKAKEQSKVHSQPPSTPSSASTPIFVANLKDVEVAHIGFFNVYTGVTAPPLATGSNNEKNQYVDTENFRPIREAEINSTLRSNQTGLTMHPSPGFTTVEREDISEESHAGWRNFEPVYSEETPKAPGQGYRSDLRRDRRLSIFVPFVAKYRQNDMDEREGLVPNVSSSKRKMDNDNLATSPPPPSKRQRQGKKAKEAAAFDLEEYAYREHILLDHTLLHSPMPAVDISSGVSSSTIGTARCLPIEHHQHSHRREGLTPIATYRVHDQSNLQDGSHAYL